MNPGFLSISAFSRASSISVRTLRDYHASGLLVPASIDKATGYRSYTVDQLADALAIVRLRALDVPLAGVHRIITARDPAVTSTVLGEHEATMRERLAETERIVHELHHGLAAATTPAHVVETEPVHVLQLRRSIAGDGLWTWIEYAGRVLGEAAGDHLRRSEPIGALYTAALEDDTTEDVTVFVVIDEPFLLDGGPDDCHIGELQGGRWASLVHTDGFASVGDTYRLLGAWVGRHATPKADGRIWERYPRLTSRSTPLDGASDSVVEVRWPIEQR